MPKHQDIRYRSEGGGKKKKFLHHQFLHGQARRNLARFPHKSLVDLVRAAMGLHPISWAIYSIDAMAVRKPQNPRCRGRGNGPLHFTTIKGGSAKACVLGKHTATIVGVLEPSHSGGGGYRNHCEHRHQPPSSFGHHDSPAASDDQLFGQLARDDDQIRAELEFCQTSPICGITLSARSDRKARTDLLVRNDVTIIVASQMIQCVRRGQTQYSAR